MAVRNPRSGDGAEAFGQRIVLTQVKHRPREGSERLRGLIDGACLPRALDALDWVRA
jgi:hypothetical protein